MLPDNIYDIEVVDVKGRAFKLEELKGNVIVVVNVASKCGLAQSSYGDLAAILKEYHSKGLRVLLFPCRQFLNQELESMQQVEAFVSGFSENFMLMGEVKVKGEEAHPLFKYLSKKLSGFLTDSIKWNFTYFLIGRDGVPVKRYGPTEKLTVDDKHLLESLEK